MIRISCDTLRIVKIDNDINGNGIIHFACTHTQDGAQTMQPLTVPFEEVTQMQFEFQAPVA